MYAERASWTLSTRDTELFQNEDVLVKIAAEIPQHEISCSDLRALIENSRLEALVKIGIYDHEQNAMQRYASRTVIRGYSSTAGIVRFELFVTFHLSIPVHQLDGELLLRANVSLPPLLLNHERSEKNVGNESPKYTSCDFDVDHCSEPAVILDRKIHVVDILQFDYRFVPFPHEITVILITIENMHLSAKSTLKDLQLYLRSPLSTGAPSANCTVTELTSTNCLSQLPVDLSPSESFGSAHKIKNEFGSTCNVEVSMIYCVCLRGEDINMNLRRFVQFEKSHYEMNTEISHDFAWDHLKNALGLNVASLRDGIKVAEDSSIRYSISPVIENDAILTVGCKLSVCIQVYNASDQQTYDLFLLHESVIRPKDKSRCDCDYVSCETLEHLGIVGPGVTIRRCIQVVPLRSGVCNLAQFLIFDKLSLTLIMSSSSYGQDNCEIVVL